MDSEANYRLVGAFIIIVSVLIIVSLLWLTNLGESRNADYYTIYFRQHSLAGLQKDSYVTMKGITVGAVVDYRISPQSVEEVKVTVRLDPQTPVTTTTEAVISRNLLTGLAAVELTGSKDNGQPLVNVPPEEDYPVIDEGSSTFSQIADSMPEILENISEFIQRASSVVSEQNVASVQNTIREIEQLAITANRSMSGVDVLLKDLSALSKKLAVTTDRVATFTVKSSEDMEEVFEELRASLVQIQNTFEELQNQTRVVGGSLLSTSQAVSQQVVTVGQDVSEAAESVSRTAESFENPRSIITGPAEGALGPGERLPK